MAKPLIITMGDPTGVGPEIIVKALLAGELNNESRPIVVAGDAAVLARAAEVYGVVASYKGDEFQAAGKILPLIRLTDLNPAELEYGQPGLECGRAMVTYINWATEQCLSGKAAGMVTAPINKKAINQAGIAFPGHTEMLAAQCGVEKVVMMLAGEKLKVCLVTTHLPLAAVSSNLTTDAIVETIFITDNSLKQQFGIEKPRLAVLGFNPHAGEEGLFGDEENRVIQPAIDAAIAMGIDACGPHSADTLFHFAVAGDYDAVVCMYHDQGLIPLKLLHFEDGVNVTLGLPIVRTSVDHGTAYNLAGTGKASCASLAAAIRMAEQMIQA